MNDIPCTEFKGRKLYKVLVEGASMHGGSLSWSLPKDDGTPGDWHETKRAILCQEGLHLTWTPAKWHLENCDVYEVEADGFGDSHESESKIVARRCRLLRKVQDLAAVAIFVAGNHTVTDGFAIAYGSASVKASGEASVTAYGRATVTAYGSASVTASGTAQVTASGEATVTASGTASVKASGTAQVTAYGSASVTAYGSAQVTASGEASVKAYGTAQVTASGEASVKAYGTAQVTASGSATVISSNTRWRGKPKVELKDQAVHVDRYVSPPAIHYAGWPA